MWKGEACTKRKKTIFGECYRHRRRGTMGYEAKKEKMVAIIMITLH